MDKFLFTPDDAENEAYTKCRAEAIAQELSKSAAWHVALLAELCELAGISDEWAVAVASDGDEWEAVIDKAAAILGVTIM